MMIGSTLTIIGCKLHIMVNYCILIITVFVYALKITVGEFYIGISVTVMMLMKKYS